MTRKRRAHARAAVAAAATLAIVAGGVTAAAAASDAKAPQANTIAPALTAKQHAALLAAARRSPSAPRALANSALPAGVPNKGNYAFLVQMATPSTGRAFAAARVRGLAAAREAGRTQLRTVTAAQNSLIAQLPAKSHVLYRDHAVLSGVAVVTDVHNYAALTKLPGVTAVYPIAPKSPSNSYAVPLQKAPQAWEAYGDLGQNSTVAIIDTGVDYTHANFGGAGTVADYNAAKAQQGEPVSSGEFPGQKVIGGYDLAGDSYQADPNSADYNPTPSPDPWPLDCNGHGSHVAGTVAGYGENADGSTYTGAYNTSTPFDTMRIGPGMAPEAKLYAYRVFGCTGSTDLVGAAIDMAADPNGDGSTSDHVNVINMSLGSDFGSPQDGDSVATNAAAALGITVVVASGNAGDIYDIGGSPGDATRALTVAASADASSVVDSLNMTAPSAVKYPAERSVAYDWANSPDLSGDVVQLTQPGNLDGCDPITGNYIAQISGHVAFVEWNSDDATRRCGSVGRSTNLAAAGATGFIFGDDTNSFSAGITGSTAIPGVLVAKSGADAIRSELQSTTVTVGSTTANGAQQLDTSLNDTLAGFSSRGIREAGDVKPDVTAVGVTVFSTGNGTGNEGLTDSGTSMATPMVAGTAALVSSQHPDWTSEQVKADIMNTAGQDLFTGPNHTGDMYAPNRVGAGRIDVKAAIDNTVLAYNADDPGAVSASFGPIAVTAPMTLTKTIKVQNMGLSPATYTTSYQARTSVPGAVYTVSPSSVTIDSRATQNVTVTLTLDPTQLTKTIDPTVAPTQGGLGREFVADASGLVLLSPSGPPPAGRLDGTTTPQLRVPVYAAPRPASVMTQPASLTMPNGSVQTTTLPLSGQRVNQGAGAEAVQSTMAGFELAATSGKLPLCTPTLTNNCVSYPDESSADLKYVGVTSDAPEVSSIGGDPNGGGMTYFAVSTQAPWHTPATQQEFDIYIDSTGDGVADYVLFNTRLSAASDVMVTELVSLTTNAVVDTELLNDRFGDVDTALFDSDTMVLPVSTSALNLTSGSSRIKYTVLAFSGYQSAPIDQVGGVTPANRLTNPLTFDPLHPGVAVYGSYDGDSSALLYRDSPGSLIAIRRDAAAYGLDHALGALIVHFHNKVGNKAQPMALRSNSTVTLKMTPNPAVHGHKVTAVITVANTGGIVPTGTVVWQRLMPWGLRPVGTATLRNGTATLTFVPQGKTHIQYRAVYRGDGNYNAGNSSWTYLTVK